MCSPVCWPRAGRPTTTARSGGRVRLVPSRPWCPARATALRSTKPSRTRWRPKYAAHMSDKTAASVALAIYLVGGTLTFAWPLWWQRQRTGSTGFRGISGRPGSAEWLGGVGFPLAVITAFAAPFLRLAGVVGPLPFLRANAIQVTGIPIATVGIACSAYAQMAMGNSWRIGVDVSERT